MAKNRKKRTAKEKFNVVLELLSERKTQSEITSEYGVHPSQQMRWKQEFIEKGKNVFEKKNTNIEKKHKGEIENLKTLIGQYAIEVDWLKKKIDDFL